jgi:hypothetical protein
MAQKSGNHVKPPVPKGGNGDNATDTGSQTKTTKQHLAEQHHGEETGSSLQDDKKIGQHNGAGRPPLMEK